MAARAARAGEGGVEGRKIQQSDEDRWVAADSEDDRMGREGRSIRRHVVGMAQQSLNMPPLALQLTVQHVWRPALRGQPTGLGNTADNINRINRRMKVAAFVDAC